MADPQAALLTQLRNIQSRAGATIAELHRAVESSGLAKHGERRSWLMERYKLGYGDANTVVSVMGKMPAGFGEVTSDGAVATGVPSPGARVEADPLDALYVGTKAHLRPLHEAVMEVIAGFGPFEIAPKKTYVSLRRSKQFAMVGPATKDAIEIGLNAKDLPSHERLKTVPPGGMCQATTRVSSTSEVDAALARWLKQAYDAAG